VERAADASFHEEEQLAHEEPLFSGVEVSGLDDVVVAGEVRGGENKKHKCEWRA